MSMRRFYALVMALFAVSALASVMVSSASAEEPLTLLAWWLVNGVQVPEGQELNTETPGSILLEDTKAGLFGEPAGVLCSGILDGTVGFDGLDVISAVLNLKSELIGELTGLALLGTGGGPDCVADPSPSICPDGTPELPIEVWPFKLPWPTLLELYLLSPANYSFVILVFGATYHILCWVAGIDTEDECTSTESMFEVLNDPTTGDAEIPAGAKSEPFATCAKGGAGTGNNEADELTFINLVSKELLTVSSE
jgi:hypothetical protein